MTIDEIRLLVISADENARHHWTSSDAKEYTIWSEYARSSFTANGLHSEGWKFQIDRFTTLDDDPIVARIISALDAAEAVSYTHLVDYEGTPKSGGLIHHIFDCEG